MKNIFLYRQPKKTHSFYIENEPASDNCEPYMETASQSIEENLNYAKSVFSYPKNGDIIIREFDVSVENGLLKAFAICADGLSDSALINSSVLLPLMCLSSLERRHNESTEDYIVRRLITNVSINNEANINKALGAVNYGDCAVFVDTVRCGFIIDVKSWGHREVGEPTNETVIQGPHEGFNEVFRSDTALIRKTLNTPKLVMENVALGKTSKTPAAICYLKNIANSSLVGEVRYRMENIDVEYILSSLSLAQYIEEASLLPFPQSIATERPDRVCNALTEGRVAIVVGGSPQVLIVPTTVFDATTSPEDAYLRFPYSFLTRIIRIIAIALALLAPAMFLAVMNFHQELILTDILFALSNARSSVPFSSFVELLLMELSFELIKEAGIRVPGPAGSALGIVGGLILGQAAVSAGIVSPIMIIVVAIAGISSFAIPNYQLAFSIRLMRFIYTLAAAISGFFGIFFVMFIESVLIVNAKSFGAPYAQPLAPKRGGKLWGFFFGKPIWKGGKRPEYPEPKDMYDAGKISRKWKYKRR